MELYIRNEYQRLSNKELEFSLIEDVKRLKEACLKEELYDYYYLCDSLICDVYLEHNCLEEPLKILVEDLSNIDKVVYKSAYLSLLDRILYIYITKKNYRLAYKYASEKSRYIDTKDVDVMNRWNLEMSYIYAELNDYDKAENCLKEILKDPSIDIIPYVYSNLTKIYVDQKKTYLAEESLNSCLQYEQDEEGKVYCDYLLAKICLLKDQKREAYTIFKQIFDNEDMNQMTLPIVNEYLTLLLNLERIDEMGLVISKIALFVNASDDDYLKRDFAKNKLKYLSVTKNVVDLPKILDEYEELDKRIHDNEKKILVEATEVEKSDAVNTSITDVVSKVDKITNVIQNNVNSESLRDVILNFNRSLESVMNFDEATFVLFNRTSSLEYLLDDNILIMNYKNNRLYEKKVSFNALPGTLAEIMIEKNHQFAFDFNKSKLDVNNLFNNRSYKSDGLMYVNALPCTYNGDIFACMIYSSKKYDLTTQNDTVLYRVATKILESSLISVFLSENLDISSNTVNELVQTNNIGLVYISNDMMYLSEPLMNHLHISKRQLSRSSFVKMINKADIDRYNEIADLGKNYSIEYKLNLEDRTVTLVEEMVPYFDKTDKLLFSFGTIQIKQEDMRSLIDGKTQLEKHIQDLKQKANRIEFRYSIIRIRTNVINYSYIKSVFGVEPYFVDNNDFLVVLENEVNLKTLEKLASKLDCSYSIVRYPRDIVNIDESFNLSKVCLDNGYTIFTEDVYKTYLKKKSVNKIASKYLGSNLPIILKEYHGNDNIPTFEACFEFGSNQDDIRLLLDDNNKCDYDLKLYRSILDKNINASVFLPLQNKIIKKILDNNAIPNDGFNEMKFVIYENNSLLKEVLDRLSKTKVKVIIDANIIDSISAYTFNSKFINGIMLSKGINNNLREDSLHLAKLFNLYVYSSNKLNDYNKNYYLTDVKHEVK